MTHKIAPDKRRLADGPVFSAPPPADPPGPTIALKDFEQLGKLTKDEFEKIAAQLAEKMVSQCKDGTERWCVAVNGVGMGKYNSKQLALDVVQHWLFLKSLNPQRKVKMGRTVKEMLAMRTNGKVAKVIRYAGHVYRLAGADSVLDYLVPQSAIYDISEAFDESGDEQLNDMFSQVMHELRKRLEVDEGTKEALYRIMEVVKRHKEFSSSPGLVRNNLGKAMAALKLKTPLFF